MIFSQDDKLNARFLSFLRASKDEEESGLADTWIFYELLILRYALGST